MCPIKSAAGVPITYLGCMPKIVDHHQRRAEIAQAAATVLTRDGLDGFTTRQIAAEAGFSKGILDHYFADKGELFITVLELFYASVNDRVRVATKDRRGRDALRAAMLELLPLDAIRRREAIAEISFAAHSLSDPTLRRWYRSERRRLKERMVDFIEALERNDRVELNVAVDAAVDVLLSLMDSLSLQSVIRDDLREAEQIAALDLALSLISSD